MKNHNNDKPRQMEEARRATVHQPPNLAGTGSLPPPEKRREEKEEQGTTPLGRHPRARLDLYARTGQAGGGRGRI